MAPFYKENILNWFDKNGCRMTEISDRIWDYAEVMFQEFQSSALLSDTLEENGFKVKREIAGIKTAFIAEWSNGDGPTIALLGEYDALPGLGNERLPEKKPNGKNGHGCGHNLLGTGSMSAALCLKQTMTETGVTGTVRYYGCPAEEGGGAKVFMVRDGYFKGIDAVVRWHPIHITHVPVSPCFSTQRGKCVFRNTNQYLGVGSQKGRNALDASILMDVAVSYLRNNMAAGTTVRSMPTKAAQVLGVNPLETEVLFAVNSLEGTDAQEVFAKMVQIARGVAAATGTEVDISCIQACTRTLPNTVLCKAMLENLLEVGPPPFTDEDKELAKELVKDVDDVTRAKTVRMHGVTDPAVTSTYLHEGISTNMLEHVPVTAYCTDSGDVSWQAPMCQCFVAGQPIGSTNHSWQQVVASGSGIGHKAMIAAGKYIAMTAMNILTDPELLAAAKAEYREAVARHPYTCPIPDYAVPAASYRLKE